MPEACLDSQATPSSKLYRKKWFVSIGKGEEGAAGTGSNRPRPPKKDPAAGFEPVDLPSLSSFIRCSAADNLGAAAAPLDLPAAKRHERRYFLSILLPRKLTLSIA
jgi:hypothetical protein